MSSVASSSRTQSVDDELQAETFRRLHPRTYLERFLNEGYRPDGREVGDFRDVSVNVGEFVDCHLGSFRSNDELINSYDGIVGSISTANGSSLVRLGNTTVVCGVKAEIAEPELDSPDIGFLGRNFHSLLISFVELEMPTNE